MDVVSPESPDSPGVETLSGVESKKHRMQTGQDSDDFSSRYHLLEQLGSGASGTVWKCCLANAGRGVGTADGPLPGVIYAAKIIDLRPFKLRERFSMQRLMREVHIMQRLRHPNIIRLVEALDTPEQLVLILEYAPGVELFDAILSKTSFSEDEARPVFVQVARALQYMHSKQIVHRDVKPENVMIIDRPSEDGLYPEAKLLDFGLSKAIDSDMGGSMARTFVGTPSYLAPEVEERTAGKGKPYGTPVDCWSLGAMLYVMLVARFPEFQLQGTRKNVRMHGPLWDKVSTEAKELIKHLMAFDAGARLTVDKALSHPWLRELAVKEPEPSPQQQAPRTTGMKGIPSLPEGIAFSVPAGVMETEEVGATSSGDEFASPRQQPRQQRRGNDSRSGGRSGAWGGRLPVVTEQQTPPTSTTHKSYDASPAGPSIRELNSDEPSLDHGMGRVRGDDAPRNSSPGDGKGANKGSNAGHGNDDGRSPNLTRGKSMQVEERTVRNETAMVTTNTGLEEIGLTKAPPEGNVPLLQLQERITAVMETAVETYSDCPEGAASLRQSAALCRESLRESVTLLRKIEKTAAQVITLFPDLTLAVEEGEPDLAHDFFSTVKTWVREMYTAVSAVQANNSSNADEVGKAMKKHAEMGLRGQRLREEELNRQKKEAQKEKERQQDRKHDREQQRGGTAYVARAVGGTVEVGEGAQGDNLIPVDQETFEVVRQIQQLRDALGRSNNNNNSNNSDITIANNNNDSSTTNTTSTDSMESTPPMNVPASESGTEGSDGSSAGTTAKATSTTASATAVDGATASATAADGTTATATSTTNGTAAAAAGGNAAETMSEEKLINLFLLMAGRGQNWPPGAGGSGASDGGAGGDGAETGGAGSGGGGDDGRGGGASGEGGRGAGRGGQEAADVDMDEAVAGFAAKMSIDAGVKASVTAVTAATAAGEGLPPYAGDDKRGSWKGAMHLARLNEEKIYMEVQQALQMLQEVDSVLEQLALFWANSEVIFEVLLRKGDLVEKFVAFANKPRLLHRFRERLADYKRFWEGVQNVCNKYVSGEGKGGNNASRTSSNGTPRASNRSQWGDGVGSAYDGSYSASSNRTNSSHSSAGSQAEGTEAADVPEQDGMGNVGFWSSMKMGMEVADEVQN